jgi:thiol:disulfide interchange protein DsbC
MKRALFSCLTALLACASCASSDDQQLEKVRKAVAVAVPGLTKDAIEPSAAPGLYQVRKGSTFAYVTADGRYLIQGDMVDLKTGEEITEKQRMDARLAVIKQFGPDKVIEFAPKDPKYVVTVFTDVDCGYCRKLHSQINEYMADGIAIRYLFFPRTGPNTPSFFKAQSVWCSTDRREALTQAKRGLEPNIPGNCPNPVMAQYEAGEALGINATPMMILPDGELVHGYVPPQALQSRLMAGDWKKVKMN